MCAYQKQYLIPKELIELFFVCDVSFNEKMTMKKVIENILHIATKEQLWDNINSSFIICNEKLNTIFKTPVIHHVDIFYYINLTLQSDEKIQSFNENEEFLFIFKNKIIEELFLKEKIEEQRIYKFKDLIKMVENYVKSEKLVVRENGEIVYLKDNLLGKLTKTNFIHHNQLYHFIEEISVPFLSQ